MDWRTAIYMLLALLYAGYPLYLITSKQDIRKTRVLALGLVMYGLLGSFWHDLHTVPVTIVASMMIATGFGLYMDVLAEKLLWILALGYAIMLLTWPVPLDPVADLIAAFVVVIVIDQCFNAMQKKSRTRGE